MFADYLVEKKLVRSTDSIIEISPDVSDSVSIHLPANGINILTPKLAKETGVLDGISDSSLADLNLIYNGYEDKVIRDYALMASKLNAFNIGICTSDEKEFDRARKFYQRLRYELSCLPIRVEEKSEMLSSDNKMYLLSYRKKGDKK